MAGLGNPRPDFVMVGGQSAGKVYLMASKTLTEIELRTEIDEADLMERRRARRYDYPLPPPEYRHFITAEMKSWVQVIADSYPEAFRILFEQWTPARPELAGQQAIER